jgi:anti-sigma B factor antagonist
MLEADLEYRVKVEEHPELHSASLLVQDNYLNYSFAEQFKRALKDICRERLDKGMNRFIIDLSQVKVMDSCGLSVLIGLKKLIDTESGELVLVGLTPMVERLFVLTKLDRAFEIQPTAEDALDNTPAAE